VTLFSRLDWKAGFISRLDHHENDQQHEEHIDQRCYVNYRRRDGFTAIE